MNFNEIYERFDKLKEAKEYADYVNEITTNINILNSCPFDEKAARRQISYMAKKYRCEIDAVAFLLNNNMYITDTPPEKNSKQIWSDLNYLNNLIPLFALERTCISNLLKKYIENGDLNG